MNREQNRHEEHLHIWSHRLLDSLSCANFEARQLLFTYYDLVTSKDNSSILQIPQFNMALVSETVNYRDVDGYINWVSSHHIAAKSCVESQKVVSVLTCVFN